MRIITEHELWVFTAGAAIGSIVTYWIATRRTRFVSKVRRTIEILGDHQKFDQWFPGWRANISKIATHEEIAALRPWADRVSYHFYPWAERIRQMLGMPRKKSGILLYSEVIVAEEIICKNLLGLSVNSLDFLLRKKRSKTSDGCCWRPHARKRFSIKSTRSSGQPYAIIPLKNVACHLRFGGTMTTSKPHASTAARTLIDNLCQHQVPLLVLHDLDKAGLSILGTLKRNTRRFTFKYQAKVIDLGLRLADVRKLGLEASAEATFDRGRDSSKLENLLLNGATRAEAEFLLTRRIELNALTSDELVAFIEGKLNEHGIKKLIPKADLLRDAYRLFMNSKRLQKVVEERIKDIENEHISTPVNLGARVTAYLRQYGEKRWDESIAAIVEDEE
jgi:hypothetical protein